jgi:hypothetical protein
LVGAERLRVAELGGHAAGCFRPINVVGLDERGQLLANTPQVRLARQPFANVGHRERPTEIRDGVELIDADDELLIQRQCPITWAGCQIIIDTHSEDIEINN